MTPKSPMTCPVCCGSNFVDCTGLLRRFKSLDDVESIEEERKHAADEFKADVTKLNHGFERMAHLDRGYAGVGFLKKCLECDESKVDRKGAAEYGGADARVAPQSPTRTPRSVSEFPSPQSTVSETSSSHGKVATLCFRIGHDGILDAFKRYRSTEDRIPPSKRIRKTSSKWSVFDNPTVKEAVDLVFGEPYNLLMPGHGRKTSIEHDPSSEAMRSESLPPSVVGSPVTEV